MRDREEFSTYSVTNKVPMSPGARQRFTLEKVNQMTLKARGKLAPGQPTAKQFAEELRRKKAEDIPDQYGDSSPFVHGSTAKPVHGYHF